MAVPEHIVDRDRLIELVKQGNTPEQIAEAILMARGREAGMAATATSTHSPAAKTRCTGRPLVCGSFKVAS